MATKQELSQSFGAQGNAMGGCCTGAVGPIGGQCMGLSGRRMQIANRIAAWNALPAQSADYDPVIAALDQSSAMLSAANDNAACANALAAAVAALGGLEALLNGTGV